MTLLYTKLTSTSAVFTGTEHATLLLVIPPRISIITTENDRLKAQL